MGLVNICLEGTRQKIVETRNKSLPTQKKLTHAQKILTQVKKKIDARRYIFQPLHPRKNHDPSKMLTHVKNIFTHISYATHAILSSYPPTDQCKQCTLVTHVTTQST